MPEDMLGAALYGFHGAKVRYDSHQYDDRPVDVIVPLAEAMWWATSLDEALWSEADYQRRRDADHAGQHVRAARFARNRINHQLILAIERVEGARFPLTFPVRFFEFYGCRSTSFLNRDGQTLTARTCTSSTLPGDQSG